MRPQETRLSSIYGVAAVPAPPTRLVGRGAELALVDGQVVEVDGEAGTITIVGADH
jgi:hypothetical protein